MHVIILSPSLIGIIPVNPKNELFFALALKASWILGLPHCISKLTLFVDIIVDSHQQYLQCKNNFDYELSEIIPIVD